MSGKDRFSLNAFPLSFSACTTLIAKLPDSAFLFLACFKPRGSLFLYDLWYMFLFFSSYSAASLLVNSFLYKVLIILIIINMVIKFFLYIFCTAIPFKCICCSQCNVKMCPSWLFVQTEMSRDRCRGGGGNVLLPSLVRLLWCL